VVGQQPACRSVLRQDELQFMTHLWWRVKPIFYGPRTDWTKMVSWLALLFLITFVNQKHLLYILI